jgi:hypothetical protein
MGRPAPNEGGAGPENASDELAGNIGVWFHIKT